MRVRQRRRIVPRTCSCNDCLRCWRKRVARSKDGVPEQVHGVGAVLDLVDLSAAHPIVVKGHRAVPSYAWVPARTLSIAAKLAVLRADVEAVPMVEVAIADVVGVVPAPTPCVVVDADGRTAWMICIM